MSCKGNSLLQYTHELLDISENILAVNSLKIHIMVNLQDGESDCWPMMCPPIFCSHPIILSGSCCPTCVNLLSGDCLNGNQSATLTNTSCLNFGRVYRNGDSWPLVENGENPQSFRQGGCTSCKCKV